MYVVYMCGGDSLGGVTNFLSFSLSVVGAMNVESQLFSYR